MDHLFGQKSDIYTCEDSLFMKNPKEKQQWGIGWGSQYKVKFSTSGNSSSAYSVNRKRTSRAQMVSRPESRFSMFGTRFF